MNTVTIKNLTLGSGKPKICLPIVGKTLEEITGQAQNIIKNPVDIIEWRADWFADINDLSKTTAAIDAIHSAIGDIPLLFTIRTSNEGGELSINFEDYSHILTEVATNPHVNAIDVEILIAKEDAIKNLIRILKSSCIVIASSHDFNKTPASSDITERLIYMEQCGAQVCKMAVMPQNTDDVLSLLLATNLAQKKLNSPVITMSMGKYGLISRLCGEVFGSSLTFGCVGCASAPGQIDANELNTVLEIIHKNITMD